MIYPRNLTYLKVTLGHLPLKLGRAGIVLVVTLKVEMIVTINPVSQNNRTESH